MDKNNPVNLIYINVLSPKSGTYTITGGKQSGKTPDYIIDLIIHRRPDDPTLKLVLTE